MLAGLAAVFVAAALAAVLHRRWPRAVAAACVAVLALACFGLALRIPAIAAGATFREALPWAPALGVSLALRLDGLALVFALAITGIGALVVVYANAYVEHGRGRMLALLLVFAGSMLGLVLADDTIVLVVCWELTSICSFFLIAFDDADPRARRHATQAVVITGAGGLVLMVGLLLLAHAAGAGLAVAPSQLGDVRGHALYPAIVVAIALGAFTKSAQVPFHVWLPNAMIAPTPVSAYLHSATMVTAGVYVLARFAPALGGTPLWTGLLAGTGAATLVVAGPLATVQRDLKLTLAYSTIAVLGLLTLLIGLGGDGAAQAVVVVLVAHAAYKAALFMVAGNLDRRRGHRDPFVAHRLAGEMPGTALAAVVAGASMAGLPPLLGYIAKETTGVAALGAPWLVVIATAIGTTGLVAAAWIAAYEPFFRGGRDRRRGRRWRDASASLIVGPVALAAAGVGLGVAPLDAIVAPAAAAITGHRVEPALGWWHGPGVLGFSLATFALGTVAYAAIVRRRGRLPALDRALARCSPDRAYAGAAAAGRRLSARLATLMVDAPLRLYVAITIAAVTLAAGIPAVAQLEHAAWETSENAGGGEHGLMALAAAGAIGATIARRRLVAVASLAATGLAISLLFAVFSAPDLAITQVMVETLMVILLVAVFRRIPPSVRESRPRRLASISLAAATGLLIATLLVLSIGGPELPHDASDAYLALTSAHATPNRVNAILIEYRAFDTLGEITVLATAGIGVLALLQLRRRR